MESSKSLIVYIFWSFYCLIFLSKYAGQCSTEQNTGECNEIRILPKKALFVSTKKFENLKTHENRKFMVLIRLQKQAQKTLLCLHFSFLFLNLSLSKYHFSNYDEKGK